MKVRRSPTLVTYWRDGRLVVENYASGTRVPASRGLLAVLDAATEWQTVDRLGRSAELATPALARRLIEVLCASTLLERAPGSAVSKALPLWAPWLPHAGLLHFGTRDEPYLAPRAAALAERARAKREAPPPPTKSYVGRERLALESPRPLHVDLDVVLRARRTWRQFGRRPLGLDDLATVLGLTWGVQHALRDDNGAAMVLKTSPSGGAMHPVEVYVAAFNVEGLSRGLYHYDAARHALSRVRRPSPRMTPARYLPHQPWYRGAAAMFFMTAVVARERWKYTTPRAYRAMLLDAGHLCQTCCLVATALDLAPFCSMALADSAIETDLGVDGVQEVALYAAGVGRRPARSR